MRRPLANDLLRAFVAELAKIEILKKTFTFPKQHRSQCKVELIDEPSAEKLPNGRDSATKSNVFSTRSFSRFVERCVDTARDESKLRSSLHPERRTLIVSQHEDRRMIRRLFTPPASPALVGPRSAHRAEHVAAEYPRTKTAEAALRYVVVDAGFAVGQAMHLAPSPRIEKPFHEIGAVDPERVLEVLIRTGPISVNGYAETSN